MADDTWTLPLLHDHLRIAAHLEAWTIPYYMVAMHSIVDRYNDAYQLIQSVLHQEMLHLQLIANIANAYGYSPCLEADWFSYSCDDSIPYLDFHLCPDSVTPEKGVADYHQYLDPSSAVIGPLDDSRLNTMCLIEYPSWNTGHEPAHRADLTHYDSIGQFYDALAFGTQQLGPSHVTGGRRQIDMFSAFYRNLPRTTVTSSGDEGLRQVLMLMNVIRDQGEAAADNSRIHAPNENTATDWKPTASHFQKFNTIRDTKPLPRTFPVTPTTPTDGDDEHRLQRILICNFGKFVDALNGLMAGDSPDDFGPLMVTIGANMLTCWKNGVTPKFVATPDKAAIEARNRRIYACTG